MAIFKYTLPSGSQYTMSAPQGTTQATADFVFYTQVAAGALVGYTAGQTLSSAETKLASFELSRQDRDTAGVPSSTILSIISGAPIVAPVPKLKGPLTKPINQANVVAVPLTRPVGPLTVSQVQHVEAQIINLVDQPANVINNGIGQYGMRIPQLEQAGYLKPGTSNYNCTLDHLMFTPTVWTGRNGINSAQDLLSNPTAQTQIQTEIMQNSYNSLVNGGVIRTSPKKQTSISNGQIYTSSGQLNNLTAAALVGGTAAITSGLPGIIGSALKNIGSLGSFASNPIENISTLASGAVTSITQSANSVISTANSILAGNLANIPGNITNLASGTLNSLGTNLSTLPSSLTTTIAGDVSALITNVSQFGAPITALWAQGNGILTGGLNTITGGLSSLGSGALSSITGLADGALGSLTGLAQNSLASLSSLSQNALASLGNSMDIFGSMSQFSVDFSVFSSDSLVSATKPAAGYSNTVNRSTVDAAVNRILGDAKIPPPSFGKDISSAGPDIAQAKNILQALNGTSTQLLAQANATLNSVSKNAISNLFG
jgi:hypothetical protein